MDRKVFSKLLLIEHDAGKSWRVIAEEYSGSGIKIPHVTMWRLAHDLNYKPRDQRICAHLGLTVTAKVTVVNGVVVNGAETLGSEECEKCGQSYISNHWSRQRCYSCSPYHGRMRD